ncbi:hypothetical protein KSF_010620 [Reticulibacter mediterranei]|uniref:Uncharacterized protein n=1 Tax=Reticulibacter mediterranei TaxID=2778369 RepID=A0A8J3MXI7_9CHLR|nr:hypothetical protein KSF_010620 [Reticulibacter mediterranei]
MGKEPSQSGRTEDIKSLYQEQTANAVMLMPIVRERQKKNGVGSWEKLSRGSYPRQNNHFRYTSGNG